MTQFKVKEVNVDNQVHGLLLWHLWLQLKMKILCYKQYTCQILLKTSSHGKEVINIMHKLKISLMLMLFILGLVYQKLKLGGNIIQLIKTQNISLMILQNTENSQNFMKKTIPV